MSKRQGLKTHGKEEHLLRKVAGRKDGTRKKNEYGKKGKRGWRKEKKIVNLRCVQIDGPPQINPNSQTKTRKRNGNREGGSAEKKEDAKESEVEGKRGKKKEQRNHREGRLQKTDENTMD